MRLCAEFDTDSRNPVQGAPPLTTQTDAILMLWRYSNRMARPAAIPSPFAREAAFVNEVGRLSDADIARATGAAASTVRAWLAGTRGPTGQRAERLVELSALVERLTRVMDPSYIAVWLRKPVPALDDDKPLEVIGRGEYRRVARIVSALEESPTT